MSQKSIEVDLQLPPKLVDVFTDEEGERVRYRGAYGGRGSAKTFSFAKMTAVRALMFAQAGISGIILCGREYMNSLEDSSMAEVKAAIASEPWLAANFEIGEKYIRTVDSLPGRVDYSFAGLRHNLDSIKSKSRILILWVDEAEPVTETAWVKIVPTVRAEGTADFEIEDGEEFFDWNSEIWVTWNPEDETSATHKRFRDHTPSNSKIIELNWRDNPWFPQVLDDERLNDKDARPDQYDHIWEGGFITAFEGAYWAANLLKAREEKRITRVPEDDLMAIRLFADIGGTGGKADAFVFWAAQFIGSSINVVNHYEVQGQPISAHLNWLRSQGYTPDRATITLPHDGETHDKVFDISYASAFRKAGYTVEVIPNQGKGAANARVEAVRNIFNRISIDEERCRNGIKMLGRYHEKKHKETGMGLGPNHKDSHSPDAFGLMAVAWKPPTSHQPIDLSGLTRGIL